MNLFFLWLKQNLFKRFALIRLSHEVEIIKSLPLLFTRHNERNGHGYLQVFHTLIFNIFGPEK